MNGRRGTAGPSPKLRADDFLIHLAFARDGWYQIDAYTTPLTSRSPVASSPPRPVPDLTQLLGWQRELNYLRRTVPLERVGWELRQIAFLPEIWKEFVEYVDRAGRRGAPVRLRVFPEHSQLRPLPWEYLHVWEWAHTPALREMARKRAGASSNYASDPDAERVAHRFDSPFLALSSGFRLVRQDVLTLRSVGVAGADPLRVLVLIANPKIPNVRPLLNTDAVADRVTDALRPLQDEGRVECRVDYARGIEPTRSLIADGKYHVVHYVGHGYASSTGSRVTEFGLLFEDHHQLPVPVSSGDVARLFHGTPVRVVFLHGCHTAATAAADPDDCIPGVAHAVLAAGVPAVLGVQTLLYDRNSAEMPSVFYSNLAARQDLDAALSAARIVGHRSGPDLPLWGIDVLYLQSPDGALFGTPRDEALARHLAAYRDQVAERVFVSPESTLQQPTGDAHNVGFITRGVPLEDWEIADAAGSTTEVTLRSVTELLDHGEDCVLLAEPGGGKTTVLSQLAAEAARRVEQDPNARVPVLLDLAHLRSRNVLGFVVDEIRHGAAPFGPYVADLVRNKQCLFLFDGLDHLPREPESADRGGLQNLREFMTGIGAGNRFVFTCRRSEYTADDTLTLTVVEMRRWTPDQVSEYLRQSLGGYGEELFRKIVQKAPSLLDVIRNPFMARTLFRMSSKLGGEEGLIGSAATQLSLIDRFIAAAIKFENARLAELHRFAEKVDPTWLDELLGAMAFDLWDRDRQSGTEAGVESLPERLRATIGDRTADLGAVFRFGTAAGILDTVPEARVKFWHPLFQDYYLARRVAGRFDAGETLVAILQRRGETEPLPSEALVFSVRLVADSDRYVREITVMDAELATRCVAEAGVRVSLAARSQVRAATDQHLARLAEHAAGVSPPYAARLSLARGRRRQETVLGDIEEWVVRLGADDWEAAADDLVQLEDRAVPILEAAHDSENWLVRARAQTIYEALTDDPKDPPEYEDVGR